MDTKGRIVDAEPFREIDYRAMRLIAERCDGSSLSRQMLLKRIDKAWRTGRLYKGEKEKPDQKWRMAEARFLLGDYSDWTGWEYRDPWVAGLWHNPKKFDIPAWNGKPVDHLFIYGEQGIGDEIFFASCLPDALRVAKRITLETDSRLASVFRRCFDLEIREAEMVTDEEGLRGRNERPPQGDAWIPLGDLPRIFRRKPPPFYSGSWISAEHSQVERFSKYQGRTGISWRGAQGEYALSEFQEIVPDALSVQYSPGWDEDIDTPGDLDLKDDIEGILGLLANLSKLVTVSTSVAHFACAMGIETHVILAPNNGRNHARLPWKWGMGGRTPWYQSARVYRSIEEYKAVNA